MGVIIEKGKVGASVLSGSDSESALLLHGVAVAGKIELLEVKTLYQLNDAIDLGLDASYDETNNIRVYHHVKEFYRILKNLNITGVPLHIMLVSNTTTANELDISMEDMIEDQTGIYAKKLLTEAQGEIKLLGVGMNPDENYTSTILNGMDADVFNSIAKGQALADWALGTNKEIHVFLEGRELTGTAAAVQNLRSIENVEAGQVSVCILQDYEYASTQNAVGNKYADVGTLLGAAAALQVNQNVGEVEVMNIQDVGKDAFTVPGVSSHVKLNTIEDDIETLDNKGYVLGRTYTGYSGLYFNDDHSCTPVIIDADGNENVNSISSSRTSAKVRRRLRNALLPKVKSTHQVDTTTGLLPAGKIKYFEGIGDEVFLRMERAAEISGGKTYVDPKSDLRTPPKTLKVDYALVTTVSVGQIKGSLNIKTNL